MEDLAQYKRELFIDTRLLLGAPVRSVELYEEQMEAALRRSIKDYARYIQNWVIDNQWSSILGKNLNTLDLTYAFTMRTFDLETQYTYAYSKQVGLQARGPYELKKDFIEIESGRQVYEVPAGREVNEVLWVSPPTIDHALYGYWGNGDGGIGSGSASIAGGPFYGGFGGMGAGMGGYQIAPAFDVLLRDNDIDFKNRLLRSEMVYKITAGPHGTHLIHLLSTPGSKISFGPGSLSFTGCKVWYYYYDTAGMTDEEKDKCKKVNPDIIKAPNEIPFDRIDISDLNDPARSWVERYFLAICKEILARIRGKFGGALKVPDAEVTLDFDLLASEAKEEKAALLEELVGRLDRLSSDKQLERKALEAENLNKQLSMRPMKLKVR